MLNAVSRSFFHWLAGSARVRAVAARYGMKRPDSFARRFIAGETVDEALAAAADLRRRGFFTTLDVLGEGVTNRTLARQAAQAYLDLLDAEVRAGVDRNISIKLTQLGLDIDERLCYEHLQHLLRSAAEHDAFVRIDMEGSPHTDRTLLLFERARREGFRNVGIVLQAYLRRTMADLDRLIALGAPVRLCKGAYNEPASIAFAHKSEVDASFIALMERLLAGGKDPAIATHDERMIAATRAFADARGIDRSRFEFQMLFGIRRDLQQRLIAEGYRFRVYIPFGREWYPYFMRRLGERPANVVFVLRNLFAER